MLISTVYFAFAALAAAAPQKRQLNGVLSALGGALGKDAEFDYVVVGGGTAGLAIAKRLSEDPNNSVAVIEAGTLYQVALPLISEVPVGDVAGIGSDPTDTNTIDWQFQTEPQKGANDRRYHYARGKCLGGSSARNFMIYQRGSKQSYEAWADLVDDQSWTWDNILPYLKKSVKFSPPGPQRNPNASAEYLADAFSPSGGPLEVSYANYAQTFSSYVEGSLKEIGISAAQDFNSGSLDGVQYCSSTISPEEQKRESSQTSFLKEAVANSATNLKVYSLTLAEKIIFDNDKRATGVRCSAVGVVPFTLKARKEVILSAGAFQSPQLLMLSGIGPGQHLQEHGIEVIADRPGDPVYLAALIAEWRSNQTGPVTNPLADLLGWEKAPSNYRSQFSPEVQDALKSFPTDWPEIEYIAAAGHAGDFSSLVLEQPRDGYQYASILAALVAPLSRSQVTLKSASPHDLPSIDPNWLTHPADQAIAVTVYKRAREAFASTFMSTILANETEYFPGADVQTDKQILDTINNTLHTVWHASVSCRMGKRDDPMAVVDSNARVIGVQGLRVVDASSFALPPPGHPQSTVYMLAEKIADDIRIGR